MTGGGNETSVRVSVRIRPILGKEKLEGCVECVRPTSASELVMEGKEKRFTFDNVFGKESRQKEIYKKNVSPLVKTLFDGYNATVLAYGQTGSGKTYTMGTATDCLAEDDDEHLGMIPRAMEEIFEIIETKKEANPGAEFYLRVQFLEVYGEDIRDLLDPSATAEGKSVVIREGNKGEGVVVDGAREETVKSTQEMLSALERGALCRTTGSTNMNFHSSRSHAIFTIIIEQHLPISTPSKPEEELTTAAGDSENGEGGATAEEDPNNESPADGADDIEYRTAKFHFVDLAGSERAKRTGATGTRLKEGININKGLLALGNVISALGDETKQATHVPYRDSKLTRMLQDSLGGNSRTLMIACVSPADANIEETLNALRYANRARNIKNKPVVNRDPNSSQIAFLKAQIAQLRAQLQQGGVVPSSPGLDAFQFNPTSPLTGSSYDMGDNGGFREELEIAKARAKEAEEEVQRLQDVIEREKRQRSELQEKYVMAAAQIDFYTQQQVENGGQPIDPSQMQAAVEGNAKYLRRIEDLERQLEESDSELNRARKQLNELRTEMEMDGSLDDTERELLRTARYRKSLGILPPNDDEVMLEMEEEDTNPAALSNTATLEVDQSLLDINEDDDEVTKELKERYQKTQEEFKNMVQSYDVTLRSKQVMMQKIVEERKKYEAMKAHYEAKMAEMNAEVRETQRQRDDLDGKIKDLEGKKSTEQNKAQITRLRLELKQKNERLKTLELQAKQLTEAKRMAKKWELKEQKVQREIDTMKRQKVEFQRKMEENAKRYREESHERKLEIARLKREKRLLSHDKQKLQQRTTRDERLLKQKTEQVTSMQRKLRQAQRLTAHNRKLTEKEKKQRAQLEQWAKEKLKQTEELERLQRSLAKKEAAIARKEKLCKEMEECKRAAELRAKIAEENAAQAISKKNNNQPPKQQPADQPAQNSGETLTNQPQTLESLFFAGANEQREADNEALRELQERLEAAEFEISFQDKKVQEAAANIADEDTGDEEDGDEKEASGKRKASVSSSKKYLPFEIKNMNDATRALQHAMEMYIEMSKTKEQLAEKVERLEAEREAENRNRRELHRRKSLLPGFQGSPGTFRSRGATATSPAMSPLAVGAASATSSPINLTVVNLRERLTASDAAVKKLHEQNLALFALLKEHNINYQEVAISQMEDYVRSLAVSTHDGSRRSSLSTGFAVPAPAHTPATPPHAAPKVAQQEDSLVGTPETVPRPIRTSSTNSLLSAGESTEDGSKSKRENSPSRRRPVFDRLFDAKNFTGVAKQKLIDGMVPKRQFTQREVTVDELSMDHEQDVDEFTFNPEQYASIQNAKRQPNPSPRASLSGETEATASPKANRRLSDSPSFSRPTESYIRAQEGKPRANKRDSTGSTSSSGGQGPKPAFCSAAGPSRTTGKPYPALTESSLLQNESGTYRAEGNGLYRNSSGSAGSTGSGPASAGRAARSRQAAWESQKQRGGGQQSSPKLTEVHDNSNLQQSTGGKPGSEPCTPRVVEPGEKENTGAEESSVPIHEKLSDPKNYTGTQKHKLQQDGTPNSASSASSSSAASIKARMAQERLRRKNSKKTIK